MITTIISNLQLHQIMKSDLRDWCFFSGPKSLGKEVVIPFKCQTCQITFNFTSVTLTTPQFAPSPSKMYHIE